MIKKSKELMALPRLKEDLEEGVHKFYGATTLPDRVAEYDDDGDIIAGEILSKSVLDKMSNLLNDTSKMGGKYGAYRTVSLFHDRVIDGDQTLEEAGYVKPTAKVVPLKEYPGHYGLQVEVEVNKKYAPTTKYPDYDAEKIEYKIDKGALGLSIEYYPDFNQSKIVEIGNEKYRYVNNFTEFSGFGFARANVIGNTTAVAIKEAANLNNLKILGEKQMEEDKNVKLQADLDAANLKFKELSETVESLKNDGDQVKIKEVEKQQAEIKEKIKQMEIAKDELATSIKESIGRAFEGIALQNKKLLAVEDNSDASIKEMRKAVAKGDIASYKEVAEVFLENNEAKVKEAFKHGIQLEESQTLRVKCNGRSMKVVPTARTKDVLDTTDMTQTDYYVTNAMFADRYVPGITETFLKDDTYLTALVKEAPPAGTTNYQWKIWTEFIDASSNTLAVDPDSTTVVRNTSDFIKLNTPIKEYRDGVEVSDFTQYHSAGEVGDLLGLQLQRAAERVTQSMAADIFKENADGTNNRFLGLEAVADSTGNATLYGKTRSADERLLDATLANTYVSTSEAISESVIRNGYTKVLAQGSNMSDLAILMHPSQYTKLANTLDGQIRFVAPMAQNPEFGFKRDVMPHFDGVIPIILDYNCQTDAFYVVDMSRDGGVLIVSKPLGARGLAKTGTTESAMVNFYGAFVYKRPRNIFLHDSLL